MNREDLPSKSQIIEYWQDRLPSLGIFVDWGEPSCWACGYHYEGKYDVKNELDAGHKLLDAWNAIPLQRCHVVPRSLGGSDNASNLFLLCRECHDLAPNTLHPDIFFSWVRRQSHVEREFRKIYESFEILSRCERHNYKVAKTICSSDFKQWANGQVGLHRPQSNYAGRLSRLTPSTLVGLAEEFLKMKESSDG